MEQQMKYRLVRHHEEFGQFMQSARLKAGLSQRELSNYLGYSSAQFISNFERGIALPPLTKLAKMAKKLKLPVKELPGFYARAAARKAIEALRHVKT
jgi:transcriptional regulator with XRE-family HTH domain